MFGYTSFGAALRAMDGYGDERSATLVNEVRSAWEGSGTVPDLSHESRFGLVRLNPTREDVILVCTGMIDAFDSLRESGTGAKLNLRKTIEALFELRAYARMKPSPTHGQAQINLRESLLNTPLAEFPLSAAHVNKLRRGGYTRLRDIHGERMATIVGKCGFTEKQVASIDKVLDNFLKVEVKPADIGFRQQLESIGKKHLGDEFALVDQADPTYWFNSYVRLTKTFGKLRHTAQPTSEPRRGGMSGVSVRNITRSMAGSIGLTPSTAILRQF